MSSIAIFGAARGIGASFARGIANDYRKIHLFDVSDSICDLSAQLVSQGVDCYAHVLDVADIDNMESCFKTAFIDAPIEHLCYFIRAKNKSGFMEITPQEWDLDFDVTLKAAFFAVQKSMPYFDSDKQGSIVFVSSICAQQIGAETASYHAAKAGLENMTKYLAVNLGEKNIRVNATRLGFIVQQEHIELFYGDNNKNYRDCAEQVHPLKRIGHVDDVIAPIKFLLSPEASFVTGHILNVDGGLSLTVQSDIAFKRFNKHGQ